MYKFLLVFIIPLYLQADVDFEKEIAPIFETYCLSCHNNEKTKGKFNLSTREKMLLHKNAVKPGNTSASQLIEAVSGDEPEMPPKGETLSSNQVKLIKQWIQEGAVWPAGRILKDNPKKNFDWWSLKPIKAPEIKTEGNPVDYFICSKLVEIKITPNKKAEPEVLLRRLTYDLSGLPPTPEEIFEFLKAYKLNPQKTWESKVDELLSRKSFGEKWGRHWLDIARYADTHGYDKDKMRHNAWPYRDYVIRSFNEDKPYDKFVKEQIAGDVLYPGSEDGVIGLGFLAAGPWDFVGHVEVSEQKIDGQIARHSDRDEMLSATFNVFMSTTVQCAQCHHHKFDPIHQEDYYRLHAVFAAVDRADRTYSSLSPEQLKEKENLSLKLKALNNEEKRILANIEILKNERSKDLESRISRLKEKFGVEQRPQFGYHSQISKSETDVKWVQVDLGSTSKIDEVRLVPAYDNYNNIGAGFGFPVRYKIEVSADLNMKENVRVIYESSTDEKNPFQRTLTFPVKGEPVRAVRIIAQKLRKRNDDFIFALGELQAFQKNKNLAINKKVTSKDSIEALPRWGQRNLVDGIFHKELSDDQANQELLKLQNMIREIDDQVYTPETKKRLKDISQNRTSLNQKLASCPKGNIVYAASTDFPSEGNFKSTKGSPRPIHFLKRGNIKSKGDLMSPGVPKMWNAAPEIFFKNEVWNEEEARKELVAYLVDKGNPLVWRSIANRLWQWTFGQPLVSTPNDFGRMGQKPTHPELLDFLASRLRNDKKHSMKSIIKLLVTSEAYQRSSRDDKEKLSIDGANSYLWKFKRRRLTAEEFRDSLLFVSGVLKNDSGGPGFMDFVVEKPQHSPHYQYHLHDPYDAKSHRRSIYRFIVRSQPQPLLTTLDCADPSLSVPNRDESTTVLQSLSQWNSRFTEAMSFLFSKNHRTKSIEKMCLLTLGRAPTGSEKRILQEVLEKDGPACVARIIFNMSAFTYVD